MSNPFAAQILELEAKIAQNQALLGDGDLGELAAGEIADLETQKRALEEAAAAMENGSGGNETAVTDVSQGAAILEIRGGAGGDEAKIWGSDLLRMYVRFGETRKLKVTYIDDLMVKISGKARLSDDLPLWGAYQILKFESGVHRVQRVPTTEAAGRIHTSTASVAVLPEVKPTQVKIREEDLDWQFMRSSGAGGQNVNKVNSAVRLTHTPTGIVVVSRQERSQVQNREIALELLAGQLWEIEEEQRQREMGNLRSVIGRAQRAEKIRTYNYPQNRITDHRLEESWYNLPVIMDGEIGEIVLACQKLEQADDEPLAPC